LFEKRKSLGKIFPKISYFAIFILFLIIGIMQSASLLAGVYGLVKLLEYVLLFSYTAKNFRKLNSFYLLSFFIAGIFFESLLTIAQYLNQGAIGGVLYFLGERSFNAQTPGIANASINGQLFLRPYATFPHPNVLAAYLLIFMILIIIYAKQKLFRYQGVLVYFVLALGSLALFLTLSRVAIFAWVVFLLFLLFKSFWKKTRMSSTKKVSSGLIKNKMLLVPLIMLAVFMLTFPPGQRFYQLNFSDQSVTQREELSKDSLLMFEQNPVLGVGLNNFLVDLPAIQKKDRDALYLQPVHNIFLLVLAESGIVGLIFFMYFLTKTYQTVEKNTPIEVPALFWLLLFLGLFDHYLLTLQQGQLLMTILLGVFWSFAKKRRLGSRG
jgi:O-antigen ligase